MATMSYCAIQNISEDLTVLLRKLEDCEDLSNFGEDELRELPNLLRKAKQAVKTLEELQWQEQDREVSEALAPTETDFDDPDDPSEEDSYDSQMRSYGLNESDFH